MLYDTELLSSARSVVATAQQDVIKNGGGLYKVIRQRRNREREESSFFFYLLEGNTHTMVAGNTRWLPAAAALHNSSAPVLTSGIYPN